MMKIIIVGAGEVGFHIAQKLSEENQEVFLIDKDTEKIRRITENLDVQAILGSGTSPEMLKTSGIKEADMLVAGGMSPFDAICHAFCTLPTGGFSPKNASIAHYNSPYFETVIIVFMLLAGINFSLHYRLIKGDLGIFAKDPECRVFLGMVGLFILATTLDLYTVVYDSLADSFRYAAFQVSSIITTTGFVTADFDKWPPFSKKLLIFCMLLGRLEIYTVIVLLVPEFWRK